MLVLIACEFSGVVREAFRKKGHDAFSCDLLPTEIPSEYHFQCDVKEILEHGWELMIAHPPCTHIAVSGNRWWAGTPEREQSIEFVKTLLDAPIPKIALENPVSVISSKVRKPDQTIQPYQFGHGESKRTCLWLKGLPKLVPTDIVEGREQRIWKMGPSKTRAKDRSVTYQGIADAMAEQWG